MEEQIKEIIQNAGYELQDCGNYYKMAGLWRGGRDLNSITIYKDTGLVIDHVVGQKFSLNKLLALILNLESEEKIQEWLQNSNVVIKPQIRTPKIKMPKIYPINLLKQLAPIHDYWIKRGVDLETLKMFRGGLASKGQMSGRYVFPIFNAKQEIIGFTGRTVLPIKKESKIPRWLHLGPKNEFKWPLFLNSELLKKEKRVILLESPGDVLSFFSLGYKNVVCLFGVELSNALLALFIKYDMQKIIISTNNDNLNNKDTGNLAAEKIKTKLLNYFDESQVTIALPEQAKDFNEILQLENGRELIKEWYKKVC